MAGSSPYFGGSLPAMPAGYQAPKSTGIVSADDVRQAGAPAGYRYNPVTGAYEKTPTQQGTEQLQMSRAADPMRPTNAGAAQYQAQATAGLQAAAPRQAAPQQQAAPPPPAPLPSIGNLNPSMFNVPAMEFGNPAAAPQLPAFSSTLGPTANVPQIQAPDSSAATAAAFARAKDQVGLQTRGALTGLAGAMAGRGTVGSGVEGRGQQGIVTAGQGQLGDVSRGQAITATDLAQKNAEIGYQGNITQRQQDMTAAQMANAQALEARNQDIAQRGQDINSLAEQRRMVLDTQNSNAQRALEILKSFGRVV